MKTHTNNFKNAIKTFGRQLDSKISFTLNGSEIELGAEVLNSITPIFKSDILKSAMRELEIDSNIDIHTGTILKYEFGVLVGNEYEYINFGNYIVKSSEKQEDTSSYIIKCYDFMLRSMTEYHNLQTGQFPMTVRQYITNLCHDLSLEFANENDTFANYERVIESDLYKDLNYTYRDIFDELAQVTASTICINNDNKVEIRYINNTNDTIDEEYLKDVNVKFGEKYGPINSIVLSRSAGSDNIFIQDEESIAENGLCELKIVDNQIMNFNDRSDYLEDILEKLNGLEYYINDYSSTGICYYDICDRYNVKIGDNIYSCIMFNDEVNITQGLVENVYTDLPETSETDYTKSDKTDRKTNNVWLIVNKQLNEIQGTVTTVTSNLNNLTETVNTVDTRMTSQEATINIISTNIDKSTGEIREVTTTTGFTFNQDGMTIYDDSGFKALHRSDGTYYRDGDTTVGEYTKDGSKQKDLSLFGAYKYGMEDYDSTPMFVAQLYTKNGEKGVGHFYNLDN